MMPRSGQKRGNLYSTQYRSCRWNVMRSACRCNASVPSSHRIAVHTSVPPTLHGPAVRPPLLLVPRACPCQSLDPQSTALSAPTPIPTARVNSLRTMRVIILRPPPYSRSFLTAPHPSSKCSVWPLLRSPTLIFHHAVSASRSTSVSAVPSKRGRRTMS